MKLAVHRAQELDHALRVWEGIGGTVVLATFSARHHRGQSLRELVKGQRAGRAAVVSDRPWREDRDRLGVRFVLWAFEATHGDEHGWHPHHHVYLLCDSREWTTGRVPWGDPAKGKTREKLVRAIGTPITVSPEYAETVLSRTWDRWCQGLATVGMSALATVTRGGVRETAGFDVTVMDRDARESFRMPGTRSSWP